MNLCICITESFFCTPETQYCKAITFQLNQLFFLRCRTLVKEDLRHKAQAESTVRARETGIFILHKMPTLLFLVVQVWKGKQKNRNKQIRY